jgi:hypothetical protein
VRLWCAMSVILTMISEAFLKKAKRIASAVYSLLGVWGLMLIALLVFEEGVPFLGINGRVDNHAAAEVEGAKAGMVAQAQLDAADARLAAMTLRVEQAEALAEQARTVGDAITKNEGNGDDALKASVAADHRADGAHWSASDIDWLCTERQRLGLAGACNRDQNSR